MAKRLSTQVGPFAVVPEWLLNLGASSRAVHLYALFARYADSDGQSFPSRATLAKRLACSVDSVDRAVRELTDIGALHVEHRKGGRANQTNVWTVVQIDPAATMRLPLGTGAATPGRTGAAQNENHLERELLNEKGDAPASQPRKRTKTERDHLWDAFSGFLGEPQTASEKGRRAKAVTQLIEVGATPAQVLGACLEAKRLEWENWTEMAVVTNWSKLTGKPRGPKRTVFDRWAEDDNRKANGG